MADPALRSETRAEGLVVHVTGDLVTQRLAGIEAGFAALRPAGGHLDIELSALESFDTGGALLLAELRQRAEASGARVALNGLAPEHAALLETVSTHLPDPTLTTEPERGFLPWLTRLGERTVTGWRETLSIVSFFGQTLSALVLGVLRPWRLRKAALVSQMDDAGLKAVPIVALMGFLIGIVLAFQGAAQLKQFGAEVFVVELISISILRELGVLLTAIIVAGRSGSAFTASVGSMKVQEEIDAMRTIGLDPIEVLVVPRVLALVIVLPILGFIADLAGLVGGALMSWIDLGVSPGMFMTRLHETTDATTLVVGLVKAPFFAMAIGTIACWQAMRVQGSAESVGRRTTASVVQAIFTVIVMDALFSIFFSEVGI